MTPKNDIKFKISFILDKLCPLIDSIITDHDNVKLNKENLESKIFLIEYLTRQSSNLNALNLIYHSKLDNVRFEHSIGILLRNSLADTLYLIYLNISNNSIDTKFYQNEILKLNADQLQRTFKDNKIIDSKEIAKFSKYIYINKNGRIDSHFGKPKVSKEIANILMSSKETKRYTKCYRHWEIYSKYEHYGFLTHLIQTVNNRLLITRHINSIAMINHGITIALANMKQISPEICVNHDKANGVVDILTEIVQLLNIYKTNK